MRLISSASIVLQIRDRTVSYKQTITFSIRYSDHPYLNVCGKSLAITDMFYIFCNLRIKHRIRS